MGFYAYPEDVPVVWKLNGVEMTLDTLNKNMEAGIQNAMVQAVSAAAGDILDEIYLHQASSFDKMKVNYCRTPCNRLRMWVDRQKIARKHHKLRMLKRNSLRCS